MKLPSFKQALDQQGKGAQQILDEIPIGSFHERFPKTVNVLQEAVGKVYSGCVAGVVDVSRKQAWIHPVGKTHYSLPEFPQRVPADVTTDTFFDLASLTKVITTVALFFRWKDRGWIHEEDPVQLYLPAYPASETKLKHLLSHTSGHSSGLPFFSWLREQYGSSLPAVDWKEKRKIIEERIYLASLGVKPDQKSEYSDLSYLLLTLVLESVGKDRIDSLVKRHVWKDLGEVDFHYQNTEWSVSRARYAATEICPWRGWVQGAVHDDNTWAMGGVSGHAGVFGSMKSVLYFGYKTLTGFWNPANLTQWSEPYAIHLGTRSLGWDTPSVRSSSLASPGSSLGQYFSQASFGHLGFTGTSLWIDPKHQMIVSLLTNRVHPSRQNDTIKAFRPLFHDHLAQELFK